jgi:hypothetical protein
MDLSLEALKEAVAIREQIDQLETRLSNLLGGSAVPAAPVTKTGGGKRAMSPEGRARISAAAKARWAARRGDQASSTTEPKAERRGISAAGRKRLSEMMKARWAARKQKKTAAKKRS